MSVTDNGLARRRTAVAPWVAGLVLACACSGPTAGGGGDGQGPTSPPAGDLLPDPSVLADAGADALWQESADFEPGPRVSVATELGLTRYAGKITPVVHRTDGAVTTYRFDPAQGPMCLRGATFYTTVRDVGARDLMIFLQDGGVCWSQFCLAVNKAAVGIPKIDILDPGLDINPVAGWNHLFVPYCDGSFFLGDAEHADNLNGRGKRYHRGLANVTAALEVARTRFPAPARVLLAGSSGGSYGLLLAGLLTRHYFPDAELILMADSGHGIARDNDPAYLRAILTELNIARFIPADCAECTDRGHLTGLLGYLLRRDPGVRVGIYSSWYDSLIAKLYLQVSASRFASALKQQTDALRAAYPDRFRRFITRGIQHTVLPGVSSAFRGTDPGAVEIPPAALWTLMTSVRLGNMRQTRIGEVTIAAWLRALIENDTDTWVDTLEPPGSPPDGM